MQLSITPSVTQSNYACKRNAVRHQSYNNVSFKARGFNPLALNRTTYKPIILPGSFALGAAGVLFLCSQFAERISHFING